MSESKSNWAQTLTLVVTLLGMFWLLHSDINRLDDKIAENIKATTQLRAVTELRAQLDSVRYSQNTVLLQKMERNIDTLFHHVFIPDTDFFHDRTTGYRRKRIDR